jgi:hypothetical protein
MDRVTGRESAHEVPMLHCKRCTTLSMKLFLGWTHFVSRDLDLTPGLQQSDSHEAHFGTTTCTLGAMLMSI